MPGRIFRVERGGLELHQARERSNPDSPGLTNFFDLVRVSTSRDGRVVAVVGERSCVISSSFCYGAPVWQTDITGLPGGPVSVPGAGHISGNGQYLLVRNRRYSGGSIYWTLVDLRNPREAVSPVIDLGSGVRNGRAIADDGTAVLIMPTGELGAVNESGVKTFPTPGGPAQPVIDATGATIAYTTGPQPSSIRILRRDRDGEDRQISPPGVESYSPAISADGSRVLFVSTASGAPQIHVVATYGDEAPRQVTYDDSGVMAATMSDDGKVAWYFSGSGRLYSVDLESGGSRARLGITPQVRYVPPLTPGSLYILPGAGFSEAFHRARFFPLPRSLGGVSVTVNGTDAPLVSVSPTEIVMQAPSAPSGAPGMRVNTTGESLFRSATSFTALPGGPAFLRNPQSKTLAVHEDWSELVTEANPARPGEVIHLYGTGFGTVDHRPEDGDPAPANPPARTLLPVTCRANGADYRTSVNIPVLYSGLAPGLAGVYQLDMRVPESNLRQDFPFACIRQGDSRDFLGSFYVKP